MKTLFILSQKLPNSYKQEMKNLTWSLLQNRYFDKKSHVRKRNHWQYRISTEEILSTRMSTRVQDRKSTWKTKEYKKSHVTIPTKFRSNKPIEGQIRKEKHQNTVGTNINTDPPWDNNVPGSISMVSNSQSTSNRRQKKLLGSRVPLTDGSISCQQTRKERLSLTLATIWIPREKTRSRNQLPPKS